MDTHVYSTASWRELRARAFERDGNRCTLGRLFGGTCTRGLVAHHVHPISEGGPALPDLDGVLTTCSRHHPMLHSFRRMLAERREPVWRRCPHVHPYPHARRECERRLNRVAA